MRVLLLLGDSKTTNYGGIAWRCKSFRVPHRHGTRHASSRAAVLRHTSLHATVFLTVLTPRHIAYSDVLDDTSTDEYVTP